MTTSFAETKDLDRARDLAAIVNRNGLDKAIGAATKMAKLIKDIDKLLRRTEAVLAADLRLAAPFMDRCRDFPTDQCRCDTAWQLREMVRAFDTGKTVGRYCPVLPKKYHSHKLYQEAFNAGFAESFGYDNFMVNVTSKEYGI